MKIAIIGAAAGVGFEAVQQALRKGYHVTALSLNPDNLPHHSNLSKIKGSATNIADVAKAIIDTDAVLVTIGTKQKKGTTLFSSMAKVVTVVATELMYDKPILVISGFGVGASYPFASFFIKSVINLLLKDQYKDKTLMEEIFQGSRLNWEMVQPGQLSDGPLTSKYKLYPDLSKEMKVRKISRADLAHFLLSEAITPAYLNKKVVIAGH